MGVAVSCYQPMLTVAGEKGDTPVYMTWMGTKNILYSLPFELRYTYIQAQPLKNSDWKALQEGYWDKIQLLPPQFVLRPCVIFITSCLHYQF